MCLLQISCHSLFKSQIQCVAYQRVANRDFVCPRDCFDEILQVLQAQVVSCIEAEAAVACGQRRAQVRLHRLAPVGGLAFAIRGGVELAPVRAARLCGLGHPRVRVYKN